MAWRLEIHHIEVNQGDATLIVAREIVPFIGMAAIVRAVLIDGGRANVGADVHNYITLVANVPAVHVIVVTHYDADHVNGIITILGTYAGLYDNTIIFDQGWPGAGGLDDNYTRYLKAINGYNDNGLAVVFHGVPPQRSRVTNAILSYPGAPVIGGAMPQPGTPSVPAGAPGTINQPANWLVGREIMWTNNAGAPNNALYGGAMVPAPGAIGGPPLIRCIAANENVMRANGTNGPRPSGLLNPNVDDAKNARSLGFMVQFENFRYYIGGDLSSIQEDNAAAAGPGIGNYLAAQGRVHAMKVSHHGSGASTSAAFIAQLNPVAAFISCGYNNNFGANPVNIAGEGPWPMGHPQQRVLDDLEAYAPLDNYYLTSDRGDDDYCRRLKRGNGAWPMANTAKAVVAGGWGPPNPSAGPANPSPCGGWWPNDGATNIIRGNIRINVAAGATPAFTVAYSRPSIIQPVLAAALFLPANTIWPTGVALPANTILPAGTIWPGGANAPIQGMGLNVAHTLAINLPWPDGQFIQAGAIPPGAYNISNFVFPAVTILPANVIWGNGLQLPVGTILPAGSNIPAGIISPIPPNLEAGDTIMVDTPLPAGVFWPNGIPLPPGTSLPAFTTFPNHSAWSAAAPMPAYRIPNGTQLPVGLQLPMGLVFPPNAQWPANTAMPALNLPGGVIWPGGQVLPANTELPVGAQIPFLIEWPVGIALPGAGTANPVINH
jgi:beta-lactamase superfamily II metal-dependent hydrolase